MHDSNRIFLASDTVRAVKGIFETDVNDQPTAKRELFKTFNAGLKAGDLVNVETGTRHKCSVVKIVEVDVDIDIESNEPTRWIIGKVDTSEYDKFQAMEAEMISEMKKAELKAKRDDMREKVMGRHADILQNSAIAQIGHETKSADDSGTASGM